MCGCVSCLVCEIGALRASREHRSHWAPCVSVSALLGRAKCPSRLLLLFWGPLSWSQQDAFRHAHVPHRWVASARRGGEEAASACCLAVLGRAALRDVQGS